jgi:hypothetical protein
MESKCLDLCYLNRLGRLELRPERNGSEIGRHDAFRMRIAGVALVTTATVVSEGCVSILSDTFFKSRETVVLRLCRRLVRRLFFNLFGSSTSIALFLEFAIPLSDFLVYMRCACVSPARRLRCAASAAFCTR